MPWLHFHADTDGKVKACCSTSVTFGDLNSETLDEIWNGQSIKQFRQQVLIEGVDQRCNACLNREAAGKDSMRIDTIQKYRQESEQILAGNLRTEFKPIYWDIRYSNVCNLRCRTCWHGASSSWFEEGKLLKNVAGDQAIMKATANNQQLVFDWLDWVDEVEEIYFAGGEPLIMEEHYLLLDELAKTGKSPLLRYNTNLSKHQLKDKSVLELWSQFDRVQVAVSIDALEAQGEYVRKGLKWKQLIRNMEEIKSSCPHVKLEIAPTISIFNVMSLGELHQFFVDKGLIEVNDIYFNLLERPFYYNIVHLSDVLKNKAKDKLLAYLDWLRQRDANQKTRAEIGSIIDFMFSRAANPKYQMQFRQKTKELDKIRGEDFDRLFPELSGIN